MRAYERLIRYTAHPAPSDDGNPACPSSQSQRAFAQVLVKEMQEMGIRDAFVDEHGYVYGTIEATPGWQGDTIGLIAHLDVVGDVPSDDIRARVVKNYDGGDIILDEDASLVLAAERVGARYLGHDLVVTDGKTLLGADDRAGIACILTLAERLLGDPSLPHGRIRLGFTPDEEIGRGADLFDVEGFGAKYAYTVDGGPWEGVDYETFNAASADVTITGISTHPGTAKNALKNASSLAMAFDALLPALERPEHTEGREGFYHLTAMKGSVEEATLHYILRDHDAALLERRKAMVLQAAERLNALHGAGVARVAMQDSYRNMAEAIEPHFHIVEIARQAVVEAGGAPTSVAVRGGTDGSRLSFMGLPCPNLGTGGAIAHSRQEFASVQEMDKVVDVLLGIAKAFG